MITEEERDIRATGLRCTVQRISALAVLRGERRHLRAEEVSDLVRARLGTISGQAVYDSLAALVGAGLARRIEPAGSPALFEARAGDNHHHVVCRVCGATADVDCAVGARPCLTPADASGYVIDEAEITFWGMCPACNERGARPEPTNDQTRSSMKEQPS